MTPLSRRRALTLIASAALVRPAQAAPLRWQGRALGADVSVTLHADPALARAALVRVQAELHRTEALFSLYDPASALSRLNADGQLSDPAPEFADLMARANYVHWATNGAFDPTVQALWQALASGGDPDAARARIGWPRIRRNARGIALDQGQSLTFNGIAQGWATDRVRAVLSGLGLTRCLINIGEFAAIGGPFTLGISDPDHGLHSTLSLTNRAVATTSARGTMIGSQSHILSATAHPLWSSVTVEADSATYADAASTGFCLMPLPAIRQAMARLPGQPRTTLIAPDGTTQVIGA
ncbi:MAG: FAD:protein FMN transferase [Marinibacterium sp.]|nr:FAD:protein FMN transferase [Marinibacterium sp.]